MLRRGYLPLLLLCTWVWAAHGMSVDDCLWTSPSETSPALAPNGLPCGGAGRGYCSFNSDNAQYVCSCTSDFYGKQCQHTRCPLGSNNWPCSGSGHGTCDAETGRCLCDPTYVGFACEHEFEEKKAQITDYYAA